jgi:ABC-type nitrate/sulfonate/bicarbonate transport system ATPase subunit
LSDVPPLITLAGACIESGGVTTLPMTASGGKRLVALVGYFSPLFRLLRGEARLRSGAVRFAGISAPAALGQGTLSLASRDAPSAPWTVERYLTESARFSGLERRDASKRVTELVTSYGLVAYSKRRLLDLPTAIRRVIPLVRACLDRPLVICAEAPLSDLDSTDALVVAGTIERLLAERALVVSFPTWPPGDPARALAERADFVLDLGQSQMTAPAGD